MGRAIHGVIRIQDLIAVESLRALTGTTGAGRDFLSMLLMVGQGTMTAPRRGLHIDEVDDAEGPAGRASD